MGGVAAPIKCKGESDVPEQQQVPPPAECPGFIYVVRSGDTLFELARRFGVRLADLILANPQIRNPNVLFPGQRICIPLLEPRCPNGLIHIVQPGDTLSAIARRFGISLQVLLQANPQIIDPNLIFVGQPICIPIILVFPCCIVLQPTANGAVLGAIGGVTLIERVNARFRITFAGVALPSPRTLGNFDSYVGSLVFREEQFSALLAPAQRLQQPAVWAGARLLPPGISPDAGALVEIRPFNAITGVSGSAILRARVSQCRRVPGLPG